MNKDYGIKINITAIMHEDSSFDVGVKFEDTDGIEFDHSVTDTDIDSAVKELTSNCLFDFISQQDKHKKEVNRFTDTLLDKENHPEKYESKIKQSGRTSTVLSDKLDRILKSLE